MDDVSALTAGERAIFDALNRHGVRFIIVGMSAAVLQGANTATRDIDIWFENRADARIPGALGEVGAVWVSGSFGMMPSMIGGEVAGDPLIALHASKNGSEG